MSVLRGHSAEEAALISEELSSDHSEELGSEHCSKAGQGWWSSSACGILPWLPISHSLLLPTGSHNSGGNAYGPCTGEWRLAQPPTHPNSLPRGLGTPA